jgi:hypothetical protein
MVKTNTKLFELDTDVLCCVQTCVLTLRCDIPVVLIKSQNVKKTQN